MIWEILKIFLSFYIITSCRRYLILLQKKTYEIENYSEIEKFVQYSHAIYSFSGSVIAFIWVNTSISSQFFAQLAFLKGI